MCLRREVNDRIIVCVGVISYILDRKVSSILILGFVDFIFVTFIYKDDALDEYPCKVMEESDEIACHGNVAQQTIYCVDRFKRISESLKWSMVGTIRYTKYPCILI